MASRLTIVMLALACLLVAGLDALVLVWDQARPWAIAQENKAQVDRTLEIRSDELRMLQSRSDDNREAIFTVMDGMNEIVNLGREPNGLAQAKTLWEQLEPTIEVARQAAADLPNATTEILNSAAVGREEVQRIRGLVSERDQEEYLQAVDTALQVMIETHHAYEPLNSKLIAGLSIYEELIVQTSELFNRQSQGGFRSDRNAADFYNLRTDSLLGRLRSLREELDPLNKAAEAAALKARDAFAAVQQAQSRVR